MPSDIESDSSAPGTPLATPPVGSSSPGAPRDKSPPPRPRHRRTLSGITPRELKVINNMIPLKHRELWKKFSVHQIENKADFESGFVKHVETTLGRSLYNCDDLAAYHAAALSVRDTLLVRWNNTQQKQAILNPKRVYYLSLEWLMGRAMDNAVINLGIKKDVGDGLNDFGFNLEDIINEEPDAGLGNGGLGRLAACYIDSLSTMDYAAWGYGLRYQYGIFKQKIVDGYQVEQPDYWLEYSNPWDIPRFEIAVDVMFYGRLDDDHDASGKPIKKWVGGEIVRAMAYDMPIPGFGTENTNSLRLWHAEPNNVFDFAKFNEGDYQHAVSDQIEAETITSVLYPNDNFYQGKELRLKQQYFWVAASLSDIVRRFKKTNKSWGEFPDAVAMQLNDTHPTLAIVELMRILLDREGLDWNKAWNITYNTFAYTNHTVMQEALEKWSLDVLGNLLPRHLDIIYTINYYWLQDVEAKFPNDPELLSRVSLIEESTPKMARMAYLAVVGSHKVNGVAELHSDLLKTTIFKDFVKIFGSDKFFNITNGITPRRWLDEADPQLGALIAEYLGGYHYLRDLDQLKGLEKFIDDPVFRSKFAAVKVHNKRRLANLIRSQSNLTVNPKALFDIQVKRIHEYKRQQLNIFGVIYRYLQLKQMSKEERDKMQPRVSIFGGKSAPGYYMAKVIIKLINSVAAVVNADESIDGKLQVVFIEDYNVSKAAVLVAASDLSEHISTAGTEASGTSNMKFVLNGGLIIGTVDGANIEIGREVGEKNLFFFGHLAESVEEVRELNRVKGVTLDPKLAEVFDAIRANKFGDSNEFNGLLDSIQYHGDYYLVNADFNSYLEAQKHADKVFVNHEEWLTKTIHCVANMGFFSSDRAIKEYAETVWNVESMDTAAS